MTMPLSSNPGAIRMRRWRKKNPDKARKALYTWREKHMSKHLAICKKYTDSRRRIIREAKNKPCMDCNISYPFYVMDLDHVRGIKKTNVALMCGSNIEVLINEIKKCEVVCANCHRVRTYKRIEEKKNKKFITEVSSI